MQVRDFEVHLHSFLGVSALTVAEATLVCSCAATFV